MKKNNDAPSLWINANYATGVFFANAIIGIVVWYIGSGYIERHWGLPPGTLIQYVFWIAAAWGLLRAALAWQRFSRARAVIWKSDAIRSMKTSMVPVIVGNVLVTSSLAALVYGVSVMQGGMSGVPFALPLAGAMACYIALFWIARAIGRRLRDVAA